MRRVGRLDRERAGRRCHEVAQSCAHSPRSLPTYTVASANRSSRVAEGFLNQLKFPAGEQKVSAMSDQSSVYTAYRGNSYLFGGNAPYVEEMYENYLANPGSVPDTWREYFDALQHVPAADGSNAKDVPHLPVINAFAERAKQGVSRVVGAASAESEMARKRTAVQQLIAAYRNVGQRCAVLNAPTTTE